MPSAVDFDGAGQGTCLIWHLSFENGLMGAAVGNNAMTDLDGCYSLSNPIEVVRINCAVSGGTLVGGPFEFCVGDGIADNVSGITLSGNTGVSNQWVVTDDQGNILGLPPMPSAVDFDGAGAGICMIWNLSFNGALTGLDVGNNVTGITGNYGLSNPVTVVRNQPEGGTLTGGPFEFCVGDGVADNIVSGAILLTGNSGTNSQWVVTDDQGVILGLPPMPSAVDFDEAGLGTCLIWHLSFENGLSGAEVGNNAMTDLVGCYNLSNSIAVNRVDCTNPISGGMLEGGPFEFCVGDGVVDNVSGITLTGNTGMSNQWVVTDDQGNILGLPPMPGVVDFDVAGPGICLIWNLSYDGALTGLDVGNNVSGVTGSFALSNSISVTRNQPEGGTIAGGPFEFCVGDSIADNITPGAISLTGNSGTNSQWVVTDDQGNILGLPPMPSVVDFDGAGFGTCLIWHLSFENGLTGAEVGNNAMTDLVGCYNLSNSIAVNRIDCSNPVNGGMLEGGPFEFCVGDGIADNVSGITLTGNSGMNNQWVITDDQGVILGLPPMPGVVDFDEAGPGVCLIWNLAYDTGLTGLDVGNAVSDLAGSYALSNSIAVVRNQPEGGELYGGPFTFCVGDGVADTLASNAITLMGHSGANSQWVVTDDQGNILGLPPTPSAVDFDGAGVATCLVWHLSFANGLEGAEVGNNAMTDLVGCYSLSNPVTVNRIDCANGINGGNLAGGPFEFCVGDGIADNVSGITLGNNSGGENQWVITDDQGNILGLPPMPGVVDFDGSGPGICLIWNLSFNGTLSGLEEGNNVSGVTGDFALSNAISVTRNQSEGGTLYGGPFTFCVGDGVADNLAANAITLMGNSGDNSQWVVTDDQGNILGLPPTPEAVDFDGAGVATCLIWHLSFADGLTGAAVGNNAMTDLEGCYSLSNPITVNRIDCSDALNGGNLGGGPFEFCVGDSIVDNVSGITLNNNTGVNNQWVITDEQGNILGLPPMPGVVDFDGAGPGVCLIWNLSFNGALTGLEEGNNVSVVTGDFALSNAISVTRNQPVGGVLEGGPFEFCVGDGVADNIAAGEITLTDNSGSNSQWVVTDDQGNILGLPPTPEAVDFDGAGVATCLIWHLSFADGLTGAEVGNNAMTDLEGCYNLSNPITVNRVDCGSASQDSIVINEFGLDNKVEIKNVGTTTIDISDYWLCNFPAYNQLSSLTLDCGTDLVLEPGELVTVIANFAIPGDDGELGLYTTNSFGNSGAIIDYVEWGSTGHTRSALAVTAGIWSTGDFASSLAAGLVYEYDGEGNASTDWSQDAATPCSENTFAEVPTAPKLAFNVFPNPAVDNLVIDFESVTSDEGLIFIYDRLGSVLQKETIDFTTRSRSDINISDLPDGTYFVKVISKSRYETKRFVKVK